MFSEYHADGQVRDDSIAASSSRWPGFWTTSILLPCRFHFAKGRLVTRSVSVCMRIALCADRRLFISRRDPLLWIALSRGRREPSAVLQTFFDTRPLATNLQTVPEQFLEAWIEGASRVTIDRGRYRRSWKSALKIHAQVVGIAFSPCLALLAWLQGDAVILMSLSA